jgi:hypothetical protein
MQVLPLLTPRQFVLPGFLQRLIVPAPCQGKHTPSAWIIKSKEKAKVTRKIPFLIIIINMNLKYFFSNFNLLNFLKENYFLSEISFL